MKDMKHLLIFFIFYPLGLFAQFTDLLWDFSVKITDENKNPMQDVKYWVTYYAEKDGKWTRTRETGRTDENGHFSFKKRSLDILTVSMRKAGYFDSGITPSVTLTEQENGYWLPKGMTFNVEMIKKDGMRPLMVKQMDSSAPKTFLPKENEDFGYDLMKGDWVEPHGTGKINDIVFRAQKFESPQGPAYASIKYRVLAKGEGNGFIQVNNPKKEVVKNALELKLGTTAPEEGYQALFEFVYAMGKGAEKFKKDLKDTAWDGKTLRDQADGYWLRIRSKADPDTGELVSAHYGKIVSPIILYSTRDGKIAVLFDYMVSPEANNRSLVWDRETTLIPGYKLPSWGARYY